MDGQTTTPPEAMPDPAGADAAAEPAEAPAEQPASNRRSRSRLGRWVGAAVWTLLVALILAVALLSQTRQGQELVVSRVLDIARGSLAGELVVDGVRSRTLLTGVTLTGVRLDAQGARRFLTADSVVVRYTPLSLLLGSPRVHSTTLFGLEAEISRYPGDDFLNVERLLADAGPQPDSATRTSAPRTIGLGRISVRGGALEVLTPAEAGASRTVAAPGGGELQRIAFDIEDLDLEETMLRPGGAVTLDARLGSLAASISLIERPLVIREAFGRISYGVLGLEITEAAIRLPETLSNGAVRFGPERPGDPWTFRAELTTDGWGDLGDLQWIDPRVPPGAFRGAASIRVDDGISVELRGLETQLEASHLVATGEVRFAEVMSMRGLRVTANPLSTTRLEPWIGRELPVTGFLSGQAVFSGTPSNLQATGRLTLVPVGMGGASTTADFTGTIHADDDPGATAFEVRLEPFNYRLFEAWWPDARALGSGSARLEVNGRADDGIQVAADLSLAPDETSASRWVGAGEFTRAGDGAWATVVDGEFTPLSLALLGRVWPELELAGTVTGPVRASGPLSDLQLSGELGVGEGTLAFEGAMDLETPGAAYRLDAEVEALRISDFTGLLPEPSVVSGSVALEGSGLALDSLAGDVALVVRASRFGGARVDSATARLRAAAGVLSADTIQALVSGVRLAGGGSLGMVEGTYGAASLEFEVASLLELRPLFMGDSLLIRDELNPLEQDLLRVRGIDPDTLPSSLDVRMAGAAEGTAGLRGNVRDFELDLSFSMAGAAYGHDQLDSADVALSASGLPATFGDWMVDARARGVVWAAREFEEIDFDGTMSQRQGEGTLEIQRRRNERYYFAGAFDIDSIGGSADLREASVQLNDVSWILSYPTRVAWSETSLTVDSLEIQGYGDDPMRVAAAGTLTRGGDSDFRLDMVGFDIERALQVAQLEDIDLTGSVDLVLSVLGPSERPLIDAEFDISDPRIGSVQLTRVDGELQYADRSSVFSLEGWSGDRNVVDAAGVFPFDLALTDVSERVTDAQLDVTVTADSLAAATGLGYLSALRDVRGMLSADFHIGGTSRNPQPSGTVHLTDGAWTIDALGVRHTGVTGNILLRPDRVLDVSLATTRSGTSRVSGTVTLDDLADPALDLLVSFDRFQAVDRLDMESMISGEFRLSGRYRLPVAEGALRVDQGTLFVEEFERASSVVDLTDPLLYSDGFAVDTTVFVSQPVLAGLRNPFLDNLRVDIDMTVPRDMWLRSEAMDVEMGGELLVRYDRRVGDLVLIGELQALRGSYVVLGRTFQVEGGTVSFIGQPGINPTLSIEARSRIRRREQDALEVQATVTGSLIQPLVTLSSEEAGLSQSDLITYLVFGRPSGDLGTSAGAVGGGVSAGLGAVANQLGSTFAREVGLDYLSFSQGAGFGATELQAANLLSNALVEAGLYLNDRVFVIFVIGGRSGPAGTDGDTGGVGFRGVRLEYALSDSWFVEGFAEDRYLRSGTGGFGATGLDDERIFGAFVFREWGFGSRQ